MPACVQEGGRVMATFKEHLHLPVTKVDNADRMLARLKVSTSSLCLLLDVG